MNSQDLETAIVKALESESQSEESYRPILSEECSSIIEEEKSEEIVSEE